MTKTIGPKFGPKRSRLDPKLSFSLFPHVWLMCFVLNCMGTKFGTTLEQSFTTSRGRTVTKNFRRQIWGRYSKIRKLVVLPFSQVTLVSFTVNCT